MSSHQKSYTKGINSLVGHNSKLKSNECALSVPCAFLQHFQWQQSSSWEAMNAVLQTSSPLSLKRKKSLLEAKPHEICHFIKREGHKCLQKHLFEACGYEDSCTQVCRALPSSYKASWVTLDTEWSTPCHPQKCLQIGLRFHQTL